MADEREVSIIKYVGIGSNNINNNNSNNINVKTMRTGQPPCAQAGYEQVKVKVARENDDFLTSNPPPSPKLLRPAVVEV